MTAPLPRLATFEDLAAWPGVDVVEADRPGVEFVLDVVSGYVRLEPGVANKWPAGDVVPAAVKGVVMQAAARAINNPTAAAMLTTGPFSEQHAQGVEDVVYLTATERRVIAATVNRPRLWTISTRRDDVGIDELTALVPVVGYTDPFLLGNGER